MLDISIMSDYNSFAAMKCKTRSSDTAKRAHVALEQTEMRRKHERAVARRSVLCQVSRGLTSFFRVEKERKDPARRYSLVSADQVTYCGKKKEQKSDSCHCLESCEVLALYYTEEKGQEYAQCSTWNNSGLVARVEQGGNVYLEGAWGEDRAEERSYIAYGTVRYTKHTCKLQQCDEDSLKNTRKYWLAMHIWSDMLCDAATWMMQKECETALMKHVEHMKVAFYCFVSYFCTNMITCALKKFKNASKIAILFADSAFWLSECAYCAGIRRIMGGFFTGNSRNCSTWNI